MRSNNGDAEAGRAVFTCTLRHIVFGVCYSTTRNKSSVIDLSLVKHLAGVVRCACLVSTRFKSLKLNFRVLNLTITIRVFLEGGGIAILQAYR